MAPSSLWSRITSPWRRPAGRRRAWRGGCGLYLEQLGERTLLSAFGVAPGFDPTVLHFPDVLPAAKLAYLPPPEAAAIRSYVRDLSRHVGEDSLRLTLDFNPGTLTVTVDSAGGKEEKFVSKAFRGNGRSREAVSTMDEDTAATPAESERQRVLASLEANNAEIVVADGELKLRGLDGPPRLAGEQDVLAFLAGAYVARFADRRDAAGDSEPRDEVPSDVPPVGDVAINAAFVHGKNDELTAFRSLAAVFREELGPENGAELPATSPPECLVSYGVDVIPPRTELLPLQDGSQALVATLVADVPGNGPTAPAREAGYSELLPAGSAVGIDPAPSAELVTTPGQPPDRASEQDRADDDLSPAYAGGGRADDGVSADESQRPEVGVLDALFAAGMIPLYYIADGFTARRLRRLL